MINQSFDEITRAIVYSSIAVIGGIVSYISTASEIIWKELAIKGISSGFAGTLIGLLCIYWNLPEPLTYFLCGTFGYLGSEITISLIKKVISKKINNLLK